jgi:N-glycosylase/DNA lyase
MKKELTISYQKQKTKIKERLKNFKNLSEKEKFKEFQFCLLTPQSNAQKCWQAVEQLSNLPNSNIESITKILSTKTRFHHTKAKRILKAPQYYKSIKPLLKNLNKKNLRNQLAKEVNGYGLKEASHFLRNIGQSNNQIAILDRHILNNLYMHKIIEEPKIKSLKHYLEIESLYLNFAKSQKILPDELDLFFWSKENGELFK